MEKEAPVSAPLPVDNTDWLKTAAILLVAVDHFGYFFMADDLWWSLFGRLAAPTFFFLVGYAHTRTVPGHWIWLGVLLTTLASWNAGWRWVPQNILMSFALIRIALPGVERLVQRRGWIAWALLVPALLAALPATLKIVEYGAEGWLWTLFGLFQRQHVDGRAAFDPGGASGADGGSPPPAQATNVYTGAMRVLTCLVAAAVYVWQEQVEYRFPRVPLTVLVLGVGVLALCLFLFVRGPSRVQPPQAVAAVLRFVGRHTLEIYAVQLGLSELLVKLIPGLAP